MPAHPTPAQRPLVSVDLAIFTVLDDCLQVLLVRRPDDAGEPFPGLWALPGGFVNVQRDATLEDCALRKLREKTGVASPYLEQLGSWGSAARDPRGWSATHVYFALIPADQIVLQAGGNARDVRFMPVGARGVDTKLAFDHADLLAAALERLRAKVEYTSLPAYLLPEEFTLGDLQHVYEVVLARALDKSAFRTRMLAADFIVPTDAMRVGPNRPAQLYRLANRGALAYFPRTFSPRG